MHFCVFRKLYLNTLWSVFQEAFHLLLCDIIFCVNMLFLCKCCNISLLFYHITRCRCSIVLKKSRLRLLMFVLCFASIFQCAAKNWRLIRKFRDGNFSNKFIMLMWYGKCSFSSCIPVKFDWNRLAEIWEPFRLFPKDFKAGILKAFTEP